MAGLAGDKWAASLTQQQVCSLGSVTPHLCGAWQNNYNGLWKEGPDSAQQLNMHIGQDSHTLEQTELSTWPSPSPLQATEQKTQNAFILACTSKLTRGGESILCKAAPFVLGTHFIPEVSKYSSGEASSLRQHKGRGAQAPMHCTLNGCQLIQWHLEMEHLLKPSLPSLICHWKTWSQF